MQGPLDKNNGDNNSNEGIGIYINKVKTHAELDLLNLEIDLKKLPVDKNDFVTCNKSNGQLIITYCYDKNLVLPKGLVWDVKECPTDNYASKKYCPVLKKKIVWCIATVKGNIDAMIDRFFQADFKAGGPVNMNKMGMQLRDLIKNYPWHDSPSNSIYLKKITDRFAAKKWNSIVIRSCTQKLCDNVTNFAETEEKKEKEVG